MSYPYCVAYIVPLLVWYSANQGVFWSIIWLVFGGIPLLEFVSGEDKENPTEQEEKELLQQNSFRLITMIWVPVQALFLLWAFWAAANWDLSVGNFIFLSISVGFVTGILGINISHELIHKADSRENYLGKLLLAMVCYGHWYTEHLWGHHKEVSTPHDPATSKLGETFYSFWPRSVIGSFWSAWAIEKAKAEKKKYSLWSLQNPTVEMGLISASIGFSALLIYGPKALALFLLQAFSAFSLLEIVNYIEHYGLERKAHGKDGYEPVNPLHSWNANARVTNFFLFKLQRHSDHHAFASRRYQILRSFDESPQMPTGYAGMLLLALIPPLWFKVMNDRVEQNAKKLANSQERLEWQKNWKAYQ